MNIPYTIEVHDNLISDKIHTKIWEYVKTLSFLGTWEEEKQVDFNFTLDSPKNPNDWMIYQSFGRNSRLAKSPLANNEAELKSNHLLVYLLWNELNSRLGNQYEITGNPMTFNSLTQRVYATAHYNSHVSRGGQGNIRREATADDDTALTMMYITNLEWYPSWAGELKFYPEDSTSGDHQQFNSIKNQKNYNIGWLDQGQIVSPKPGRLIIFDDRCLYGTTLPSSNLDNPSVKIVFRVRKK